MFILINDISYSTKNLLQKREHFSDYKFTFLAHIISPWSIIVGSIIIRTRNICSSTRPTPIGKPFTVCFCFVPFQNKISPC